ncbi:MAG TPA: BamA/TamA family outer membrane protein [Myxococcota bacterium]|nr:BamA/TamA family outer membrane protein [Myxococcota bacterium]
MLSALLLTLIATAEADQEDRQLRRAERRAAPPTVRDIHFHEDQLFLQELLRRGPKAPQPDFRYLHVLQRNGLWGRATSDPIVRTAMEHGESGAMAHIFFARAFVDRVPLDTELLDTDAYRVELWYAHHGWFDAELVAWEIVEVKPAPVFPALRPRRLRGPVVDVVGSVELGEPSLIAGVVIDGLDEVSPTVLGRVRRTQAGLLGERFDIDAPYDLAGLVERELQQNGYARAVATVEVEARPEEHAVDLLLEVKTGEICMFGEVEIVGFEEVEERFIRSRVTILPGERYDPRKMAETQRNLFGLGVFSVVQVFPQLETEGQVVPVQISVRETRFRELKAGGGAAFGAGFFRSDGMGEIRAVGRFSHTHLLSRLIRVEAEAKGGYRVFDPFEDAAIGDTIEDTIDEAGEVVADTTTDGGPFLASDASLVYPEILGTRWSHTPDVGFEIGRERSHSSKKVTMAPVFTYQLTDHFAVRPGYRWTYTFQNLDPEAALFATELGFPEIDAGASEVDFHIHKLILSGVWDTRRPLFQPARGHYIEVGLAQAGAWMPGRTYAELRFDLRKYQTITPGRIVLAGRVAGGLMEPFGSDADRRAIPHSERYLLGGASTLRGFPQDLQGPRGCSYEDEGAELVAERDCADTGVARSNLDFMPFGGQAMVYANIEARVPFNSSFDLVVFHDLGGLWSTREDFDWRELQPTAGVGARVATPAGPLRVDVGVRLRKDPYYALDRRYGVYIALQEAF